MMVVRRRFIFVVAVVMAACSEPSVAPLHDREQIMTIARHQGDQQIGTVAMPLPTRMVVMVQDVSGRGKPGVPVTFTVTNGDGWVANPESMLTDAQGLVSTVWYLGPRSGSNQLTAQSSAGIAVFRATANEFAPGVTYRGMDGLIELRAGTLPVIVTAPHGGTLTPDGVPALDEAGTPDTNTASLAFDIGAAFDASLGSSPTVLVSHLERTRVELDGPAPTAPVALRIWREYHGMLEAARLRLQEPEVRGLIVDVHGHPSADDAVQLGYLLTPADLAEPDNTLNGSAFELKSSIRDIARGHPSFARVVRGEDSLGGRLSGNGVEVVPSPTQPAPAADYLAGTYTSALYGSQDGSLVSAVALQVPEGVRDDEASRTAFALAFADALDRFFTSYLGASLSSH